MSQWMQLSVQQHRREQGNNYTSSLLTCIAIKKREKKVKKIIIKLIN
jgi:hypothetical protein